MIRSIRTGLLLSATALALVAAPVVLNATPLSDLSALAGGKGNGNGNGGEKGNSGNGNSENAKGGNGNSGGASNGNGGGNSAKSSNGNGASKKVAATELAPTVKANGKVQKTKNLNAQLAGLNSLNRNVNGLMNSNDKRMVLVREFVQAGADLSAASAALDQAGTLLGELQTTFDTYMTTYVGTAGLVAYDGSTVYDAPTLQGLTDRLAELDAAILADPTNQAAIDEQAILATALDAINASAELAAVAAQQGVVDGLDAEVAALEEATSEEALKAALLAAANKNRVAAGGDAYLTPEIMAWAQGKIDTLTADYIAQQ
ncbi:MAG: hypothetical protein J0I99_11405 [Devosia sp.]|uniref:hypothetical protein n=1 Tax=Devosia sp. TaxID=1871048 RepID=UPI001ACA4D2A|nr:hypothetical protein [Devosia sp.]MBN9316338.1 hypothetical protein [Devosia sp.]